MLSPKNTMSILINVRDETDCSDKDFTIINYLIDKEKAKSEYEDFNESLFDARLERNLVSKVVDEIIATADEDVLAEAMRTQEKKSQSVKDWLIKGQIASFDPILVKIICNNPYTIFDEIIDLLTKNYKVRKKIGLLTNEKICHFLNDFDITFWKVDENGHAMIEADSNLRNLLIGMSKAKLVAKLDENGTYYLETNLNGGVLKVLPRPFIKTVIANRFGETKTIDEYQKGKGFENLHYKVIPAIQTLHKAEKALRYE